MSEKLYAFLLRLFPARFRQSYGEDALQLFRDRARHETGFPSRLRLWLDLLADLAISVPREYFYAQPELLSASAPQNPAGSPSFYVLNQASPRPGALLFGFLLSFAALLTFSNLLSQGSQRRTLRTSASPRQAFSSPSSKSNARPAPQAADDASFSVTGEGTEQTILSSSHASTRPSSAVASKPSASRSSSPIAAAQPQITPSERHRVVAGAAANLKEHYAYPDLGQKMSDALLAHERRGDDNAATDGTALASLLTRQMRGVSNDLHLDVLYSTAPLPGHPDEPSPQALNAYRQSLLQTNCTVEKVAFLRGNIGYLKLNSFPDLSVCRETVVAAMHRLNHAGALIFDLRDNRGGQPDTVAFLASYLFDRPEYFYNPRENTTSASWTHSPVPGNLLADKPVYVLTSSRTYSGAEQFCYDLKMLKRATLVGETTGGAAHAGVFHRLDDHFGIGVPEAKPINPYGAPDWAETGVAPDIKVPAGDALATAQTLALARLKQK